MLEVHVAQSLQTHGLQGPELVGLRLRWQSVDMAVLHDIVLSRGVHLLHVLAQLIRLGRVARLDEQTLFRVLSGAVDDGRREADAEHVGGDGASRDRIGDFAIVFVVRLLPVLQGRAHSRAHRAIRVALEHERRGAVRLDLGGDLLPFFFGHRPLDQPARSEHLHTDVTEHDDDDGGVDVGQIRRQERLLDADHLDGLLGSDVGHRAALLLRLGAHDHVVACPANLVPFGQLLKLLTDAGDAAIALQLVHDVVDHPDAAVDRGRHVVGAGVAWVDAQTRLVDARHVRAPHHAHVRECRDGHGAVQ